MKRTFSILAVAALLGLMAGLLIDNGRNFVSAQNGPPSGVTPSHDQGNLTSHHQHLDFEMPVGQFKTFPLPVMNRPVRLDVSGTNMADVNGVVAEPSIASAIVVYESATGQSRNTGLVGHNNFGCGGEMNVIVNQDGTATLTTFTAPNNCSETIPAKFSVSMWY